MKVQTQRLEQELNAAVAAKNAAEAEVATLRGDVESLSSSAGVCVRVFVCGCVCVRMRVWVCVCVHS